MVLNVAVILFQLIFFPWPLTRSQLICEMRRNVNHSSSMTSIRQQLIDELMLGDTAALAGLEHETGRNLSTVLECKCSDNSFLPLFQVDRELQRPLKFMDTICDLLYHVKYQFTGDSIRLDVERIEKELSPPLQLRLRFIAPKL